MLIQSLCTLRNISNRICSSYLITVRLKSDIDYTKVPQLLEKDLEEQFVRGSGPGGQSVNKTANKVILKHLPTGIIVQNHETRSLDKNRKYARTILTTKLDNIINKEHSVESQIKRKENKKMTEQNRKRNKLKALKDEWKQRENIT